jgi:hypothetical protein
MNQPNPVAEDEGHCWTAEEWKSLLDAIFFKQCTPFLGAGACAGTLPTGKAIAREWSDEFGYPFSDKDNLPRVAQYMAITQGVIGSLGPKFNLRKRFDGKGPPDFEREEEPHRVVADLELPVYITTNYDSFMLAALERDSHRKPVREVCQWKRPQTLATKSSQSRRRPSPHPDPSWERPLVFHLHGVLDDAESMVLTEDDYLDFLTNISEWPDRIPSYIQARLSNTCLLFLGYSLNDMSFKVLFRRLAWYMQRTQGTRHISVQLAPQPASNAQEERRIFDRQREYLERHYDLQNVKVYWGSCSQFAAELSARWKAYRAQLQ